MADDIATADLEWRIWLARKGDSRLLHREVRQLRKAGKPLPKEVEDFFFAGVLAGIKFRPSKPSELKHLDKYLDKKRDRQLRARWVAWMVDAEMRHRGKQRDTATRDELTNKFCKVYGTTSEDVQAYRKRPRSTYRKRPYRKRPRSRR